MRGLGERGGGEEVQAGVFGSIYGDEAAGGRTWHDSARRGSEIFEDVPWQSPWARKLFAFMIVHGSEELWALGGCLQHDEAPLWA